MSAKLEDEKFENPLGWNFSIQYRVIMGVLMTGSLFRIVGYMNVGVYDIVIMLVGVFVLFTKSKLEIDFEKKLTREARYLFGINVYGTWDKLPQFDYVSVFNERVNNSFSSIGSQSSIVVEELQINLVYNTNRRLTTCTMPDKETALLAAKYFSSKLGDLRILDATQKPFEWLDEK
jgi:hypothetical protein